MTIVILIILALTSINAIFGEDGLIASAQRGGIEHTHATVWEAMELEYSNYWIDKVTIGGNLIKYLQDKNIIGQELHGAGYVINVETLLGTRMSLGNGKDGENDVYKLEEISTVAETTKLASTEKVIKLAEESTKNESEYRVKYYGPSGNRVLGILGDNISNIIESDEPNFMVEKARVGEPINKKYYEVGEAIHYNIKVTNIGKTNMSNVEITDVLTTAGETTHTADEMTLENNQDNIEVKDGKWYIRSIEAGKEKNIEYSYTVKESDVGERVINAIIGLKGNPAPKVPPGHKIPTVEVPEEEMTETGSIVIEKDLKLYNQSQGNATFVFEVSVKNKETIKKEYVSLVFSTAEKQSVTIEDIPVGAEVTVTEVYSGGAYEVVGGNNVKTCTVRKGSTEKVTFENTYNYKAIQTNSILNHYKYVDGNWVVEQKTDSKAVN